MISNHKNNKHFIDSLSLVEYSELISNILNSDLLTDSLASAPPTPQTTLQGHQPRLGTAVNLKPRATPMLGRPDALCVCASAV